MKKEVFFLLLLASYQNILSTKISKKNNNFRLSL